MTPYSIQGGIKKKKKKGTNGHESTSYSEKGSLPPPKKSKKGHVDAMKGSSSPPQISICIVVGPNDMVVTNFLWVHIGFTLHMPVSLFMSTCTTLFFSHDPNYYGIQSRYQDPNQALT